MFGPFGIPHIEAPQALSYKLYPEKQLLPGQTTPVGPGNSA